MYWIKAIFFDALLVGALYLWLVLGMDGAGRVAVFSLWFIAVLRILIGLCSNKSLFKEPRPKGFKAYHCLTDLAVVLFLAWIDRPVLAALLAVGFFMFEAAREREPKAGVAIQGGSDD